MAEKDWKATLEALMRKAEDPATPEAERDTIVGRVTYLMAKYGIEEAMLSHARNEVPRMVGFRLRIVPPYPKQKYYLARRIAESMECQHIDIGGNVLHIFGAQDNIERSVMLYMSLVLQMATMMVQAQNSKPEWEHGRTFNTSFCTSYVQTVAQRVQEFARRARQDVANSTTGNGMELVLVNNRQLAMQKMREEYPFIRMSRQSMTNNSSAGSSAGRSAGQRADIGGTRISGGRQAIGR